MRDSAALRRVKNHTSGTGAIRTPRMEGIWLSLDQIQGLITHLKTTTDNSGNLMDSIAFMIGKLNSGRGGSTEYTVEILPFKGVMTGDVLSSGIFMSGDVSGVPTRGYLANVSSNPTFNNEDGGGGGNQKTPPPTT